MDWFNWIALTALLVVCVMWVIELRGIFTSEYQAGIECGSAKSDGRGSFRPRAGAMGRAAGSQAKKKRCDPALHRARAKQNAKGKAGRDQKMAKPLPGNGEGVSK